MSAHTQTGKHTHLAVDLVAAQGGLNDVKQRVCQAVALPHPASRLLTCRANIPVTHTHKEKTHTLVTLCVYVSVSAKQ